MTAPGMSKTTNKKVRCVVIGAGGYSGAELIDLLLDHPHAQVVGLFASAKRGETGKPSRLADIFPRFAKRTDLEVLPTDLDAVAALKPDVVFLATPNEASYELGDALIARGLNVIDLSGAFRLKDTAQYPKHYGFEHKRQDLLDQAIYGLPELYRKEIADADDPDAEVRRLEREYRERFANPYIAAARGYIDDVIDPRETRARVISAFDMLQNKRDQNPPKKHGNVPL